MGDDAQEPEAACGCLELLWVGDLLQGAVRIHVLDRSDEVTQSLVAASCTVAHWSVAATKCDLNHDDVDGKGELFVLDAPAPQALVRRGRTNPYQSIALLLCSAWHDLDALKLIRFVLREGKGCGIGEVCGGLEVKKGNEDATIAAKYRSPGMACDEN